MVVANFLLEPATQARAQDVRQMGNFTVLDLGEALAPTSAARFDELPRPRRAADQRRARHARCSSRIRRG